MDAFYKYHPGSSIGSHLLREKNLIIDKIVDNPAAGVKLLEKRYKFGKRSDFWDDFIFSSCLLPALAKIVELNDVKEAVIKYCCIDEALFLPYIRRDEDPVRFRRAFWNVNSLGKSLALRFKKSFLARKNISQSEFVSPTNHDHLKKNIAFVFKGPFHLAHAEFFLEFLRGSKIFSNQIGITLILLDAGIDKLRGVGIDHVNIISLGDLNVYDKLNSYYDIALENHFDHISWVACVQNLSLYMGEKVALTQSYWSMKYHSIIMDSIDKYAGLGFGGDSFKFDDVSWYRGRAFPDLTLPVCNPKQLILARNSKNIPDNAILGGCFVRSEKLNNRKFWELVSRLLEKHDNFHFAIASQSMPDIAKVFLDRDIFKKKFHSLGWVNTKEWCQNLDIYIDSFPRGSCLTALESIKADTPLVMFDSSHNRESSAFPYLSSAYNNKVPPGVLPSNQNDFAFQYLSKLILSKKKRQALASKQLPLIKALEGMSSLYAKDYLNYFLDTNLSLKRAS